MNNIEEFVSSIRRYGHLAGFKIDIEIARKIEEIQLNIINDINKMISNLQYDDLNSFVSSLSQQGTLQELIKETSKSLGEEIEKKDADNALKEALEGNMDFKGAKTSLIVLQALSRLYAEKFEEKNGNISNQSPYCPVCGSESKTMIKTNNEYKMVCHFCGYTWKVSDKKIVCPYCGNDEEFSLGIFSDKEGRIGLVFCQKCKSSWRIILDESIKAPSIVLPLIALGGEKFKGALPKDI
ncbi:uncharacterized protein involved in formate dehydrogenase formation [Caldisphaera lagunensis DSM 15908]|uniref:Uncharacterized protein involved in formate dehydrogenase formation n=1 Tax=Caldisphaera lagunensis (strain DSM 15908 / JCM 11604 / ANMR 0165 / IC-154) TaxID=1056495 RepID=L0AAX4_CALLD|nr:formate dehydrogenase accessory protein FdhE [Caldisphaera lagunensis]AFZ71031.1 uncharacterized protein involved in formate dehydrogenase formation [Caldisphaera lagunensis DSM 15908]